MIMCQRPVGLVLCNFQTPKPLNRFTSGLEILC